MNPYGHREGFPSTPQQQQQQGYYPNNQYRQSSQYNFNAQPPVNSNPFSPIQRSNTFSIADRRENYLWDLFLRVDTDRSGSISVYELQTALVNGDWSPFNIETVRMMVGIFDTDNNGTIDFGEFRGLWKYVEDWSRCFKKFDQDNSGSIDCYEMSHALRTFGYNVSDRFIGILIQTFDKYGLYNEGWGEENFLIFLHIRKW
ncbi:uncharacterized protein EV154DRAFT_491832 [Mucor mucedo]|uniref:uncharacterized protein n=1 Tax=Mucor mucedo TaxID=29922 RepID=UPI00221F82EE|nr:uncharacterized protein EV154DRAFT_491832 [Mucor mucedo]KAI7896679.1 hypothetical protein EV154DRAFT_491832 [Mucor mucedo]